MIWFDLDNSPHVPLFRPVFKRLDEHRIEPLVTAREFAQTRELLDMWGMHYKLVGHHGGRNKVKKVLNTVNRAIHLAGEVRPYRPSLAVSHGSRSQVLAAKMLGIAPLVMIDYEYTENMIFNTFGRWLLVPSLIPGNRLERTGFDLKKVIRYDGFKEELYLAEFMPDPSFRRSIDISESEFLVTLRPPSTQGNYHDDRSEALFSGCLSYFSEFPNVVCLIVNRTSSELRLLDSKYASRGNVKFLLHPVDGLQLLWASDIVISGGGTMNRESALMGTETYSIFTGRRPYLDEYLSDIGRLKFIERESDFRQITVQKRSKIFRYKAKEQLVKNVTDTIIELSGPSDYGVYPAARVGHVHRSKSS